MDRSLARTRVWLAAVVTTVVLLLPAAAQASTASVSGGVLTWNALAGESNFMSFTTPVAGTVRITESLSGGVITPGAGCVTVSSAVVDCTGATSIVANALDGNDLMANTTSLPTQMHGGDGYDSMSSSSPSADSFDGGPGVYVGATSTGDKVSYQSATSGVTASLVTGQITGSSIGATDTMTNVEVLDGSLSGNDTLIGDSNDNQLFGNGGNDILRAGAGSDNIQGGTGNDTMEGGPGGDALQDSSTPGSLDFADYSNENGSVNIHPITSPAVGFSVSTPTGTDGVYQGIENFTGSPYSDYMRGDASPNVLNGGGGDDFFYPQGGDTLDGGTGINRVDYGFTPGPVNASLFFGSGTSPGGTDTFTNVSQLTGSSDNDTLEGDYGDNRIDGYMGDDTIDGLWGNDDLDGGQGTNTVGFTGLPEAVTVDLSAGTATTATLGSDTLINFQNVLGSTYDDTIHMRDGVDASVDCDLGSDNVEADPGETITGCETVAPYATGTPPAPTGGTTVGDTLTAAPGSSFGGTTSTYNYQWQRCPAASGACSSISGATNSSYTTTDADQGKYMRALVTATNTAGSDSAQTPASGAIQARPGAPSSSAPATTSTAPQQQVAGVKASSPRPVYTQTADAEPVSGNVLVQVPGSSKFVPLTQPTQLAFGSIVDARKGRVRLTTIDANGNLQTAEFYEGIFRLLQQRAAGGITELVLLGGNFKACPKISRKARVRGKRAGSAKKKLGRSGSVRHLWGSGHGLFRTKGRYSSASIRGTTWLTDDRCDGTLTRVTDGVITVRDFVKKKNVVVKAPKRYLAQPKR